MNTNTEQNRKLAETLRSISIEPSLEKQGSQVAKDFRHLLAASLVILATSATVVVVVSWPGIVAWSRAETPGRRETALAPLTTAPSGKPAMTAGQEAASPASADNALNKTSGEGPDREMSGSGYVVAPRVVTVFSKYEGQVRSVDVKIGDEVEAGQNLVAIDDISADFALEQAQVDLDSAKLVLDARGLDLQQARTSLERSETLAIKNVVSMQSVDQLRTTRNITINAVDQARHSAAKAQLNVKIAQEHVDALVIKAPIGGTVTQLDAHPGDRVLARVDSIRESQSLLTITDTNSLVIDADVAETNLGTLRSGLRGEAVLDSFPERPFAIEVLQIWPVASAEKGTITLRLALLDPPDGIRPNMAARVRIPIISKSRPGDTRR